MALRSEMKEKEYIDVRIESIDDVASLRAQTLKINGNSPLSALPALISQKLKINAIVLPILREAADSKTVSEYCECIKERKLNTHFKVINRDHLPPWGIDILTSVAIPLSTTVPVNLNYAIRLLSQALPREIREAMIVGSSYDVTMLGSTATDTITDAIGRKTVQVHPFPQIKAGASAAIFIKIWGNLYILLVDNRRGDRRPLDDPKRLAGIPSHWTVPEGHLNNKPCDSSHPARRGIIELDDEAEELILSGISMKEAYTQHPPRKLHSLGESMVAGVLREIKEEVGLSYLESQTIFSHQLHQYKRPMMTNVYCVDGGTHTEPPRCKVDGVEIKEAMWAKLHAFQLDVTHGQVRVHVDYYDAEGDTHPVEVTLLYALLIGRAVQTFRDHEIHKLSPLFENRNNVEAKIKRILQSRILNPSEIKIEDILGSSPESLLMDCIIPGETLKEQQENRIALAALGKHAVEYHKKIIELVKFFEQSPEEKPINAQAMQDLLTIDRNHGLRLFSPRSSAPPRTLQQSTQTLRNLVPIDRSYGMRLFPSRSSAPVCALQQSTQTLRSGF